jgi:hypothetical protein
MNGAGVDVHVISPVMVGSPGYFHVLRSTRSQFSWVILRSAASS